MSKTSAYLQLIRPHQYIKNGFIWLPLFFGYQSSNPRSVVLTAYAFAGFCLLSSAVYVINDLKDVQDDRRHPVKKHRPLAAGTISRWQAVVLLGVLLGLASGLALVLIPTPAKAVMGAYLLLNLAYTYKLKHIPIVDIVCIAMGFVLRVLAGGESGAIPISPWIVIMTFLLALFLALAKRKDDLLLADQGHQVRKAIDGYNAAFISLAMGIMASVIIVAYLMYAVSPEIIAKHGTHNLYITAIWVILGLLRYLQITFVEEKSGSPTRVLLGDRLLQGIIALWLVHFFVLLYA